MVDVLISWVGNTDLRASAGEREVGSGPVGQAVEKLKLDEINLLSNYSSSDLSRYGRWLRQRTACKIETHPVTLSGPTNFNEIYEAAVRVITAVLKRHGPESTHLTFHLSPGTPAMAAVFVLLSKTRFHADLIQTSKERGLEYASVPFEMSADYIPDLLRRPDEEMERLSAGLPPEAPEFDEIIRSRGSKMERVIALARRVAPHKVPVLIEGESGTGKELLARAIHKASPRRDQSFIPVNCGAIPGELIESELFGHTRGAFSGAVESRKGHFLEADGGTIFLDEIGELPLTAQVKLLRTVQESEVTQVGASRPKKVDVRIIAATNRNLADDVASGKFREDLFYRLAVMILRVPPLRDRHGDIEPLIDGLIEQLYGDSSYQLGADRKKLSSEAKSLFIQHSWPGNVRELRNTILRALIWSTEKTISLDDARNAIIPASLKSESKVLNQPLGDGFNLQEIMSDVASHYLKRALEQARGNKTEAAKLVGLPSYQTFGNWMSKYKVSDGE